MPPKLHNEWFRPVFTKRKFEMVTRPKELVDQILARPGNTLTREFLEAPYETVAGYVSSRKSCPECKAKLDPDEFVWSWGEYVYGKWKTVTHFCKKCFDTEVSVPLQNHRHDCGCQFALLGYSGTELPSWLSLPPLCNYCNDSGEVICANCDGTGYDSGMKCLHCVEGYDQCPHCLPCTVITK